MENPSPSKGWQWPEGSPFVAALYRSQTAIRKAWNYARFLRLANLAKLTEDELFVMVGARRSERQELKKNKTSTSVALNLQRLEDYVIHRKVGVPPKVQTSDALLVLALNSRANPTPV